MIRAALVLLCLCASGCVSVPLSTLVRMSTFDEHDFAALDGGTLRVRITLPQGFELNVPRSWLGIELKSAAGVHEATFQLDPEQVQAAALPGGLFSATAPGTAYVLRLSERSKTSFRELQGFVARGRADEITIRVVPRLASSPAGESQVSVWIDLLLSQTQGFFTLVDGAVIPLDQIRGARKSEPAA